MKIKAFLFAALLLAGVSAFAQEASEGVTGKGPTDSFISNSFKDNWFIGGAAGLNLTVDNLKAVFDKDANTHMTFGTGLGLELNFGKWLDPMWGIRGGFSGITNKHDKGSNFYYLQWVHGDVMWNITNQIWGYKPERFYHLIPYLSAGAYIPFGNNHGTHFNFGVGAGLLNTFRMSEKFDLTLDLRGVILKDNATSEAGGLTGYGTYAAVLVGGIYKLGHQGWQTKADALMPATIAVAEASAALAAAQAEKEQLAAEKEEAEAAQEEAAKANDALQQELAENAAQNAAIVKNLMETPAIVYFEIGQATLSVKELEHFDRIVKTMLSQDKEMKFTLTGLTDHNTGSARRNKQLQKQRSNYIHKLLADKYGLEKDQFEIVLDESAKNRFTTIELNRAVIIESAKAAEEVPAE